jgi:hypothetical protein
MSTALIGCVQSTPASLLSSTSASSSSTATTTVTVEDGTGSGTYTYQWTTSGAAVTLSNGTTVSPTFTYSAVGTTTALCNITDTIFGITVTSPNFVITWSSPIISTTFTFTPSVNTSYTYDGSTRSITVTPNPAGATYSVTSGSLTVGPSIGSTSAVVTANGSYSGSATSPTITIIAATITAMSFTLNGTVFTTTQNRASGTSYTIAVGGTTPAAATKSPTSTTFSTDGSYSLTSSGTGNYTGTFTSATVRVTTAVVSWSPITPRSSTGSASLTSGVTPTAYAWSRVSGTSCSFSNTTVASPTINEVGTTNTTTVVQCIVSFSGGTSTSSTTIQWGIV